MGLVAEMADRGSDIGEEREPHNEDGCTPDTEHCVWNLSMMIWTLVPTSQAMGSKVGYGFLCDQGCSPRTAVKSE